ncbi:MAG: prolipoprotein diacylglyceryl transferase family protein [Chloroflexota bacterium]
MLETTSVLFGNVVSNYTLMLILGTGLSFVWMIARAEADERVRRLDVCIASLIGAIVLGRAGHVILNWAFFTDRTDIIWRLDAEGGLLWQGCLLGALLAGWLMAKVHKLSVQSLLMDASVVVPLLAVCAWLACDAVACAYGQSVERLSDYPAWQVWIAPDIFGIEQPRFATQRLGAQIALVAGISVLIVHSVFRRRSKPAPWLFWGALLVIAGGNFGIGFLRGDYALVFADLRIGQWLDAVIAFVGLVMVIISVNRKPPDVIDCS